MATYKEIQAYVKKQKGYSIKTCWIADMKHQIGLPMKKVPSRIGENFRTNPCPEYKKEAILEAFKHFGMIR